MDNLIDFFVKINKLKDEKRTGWIVEGIKNSESVAEHSFRTALMALVLGSRREDLDTEKCIKMALIHDLAESQTGDILIDWKTSNHGGNMDRVEKRNHGITDDEKYEIEKKVMQELTLLLDEDGKEYFNLWLEFEEKKTPEAKFVRSLDKLEMLLQAYEYEKSRNIDLSHWINNQRNKPPDEEIEKILKYIKEKREREKRNRGPVDQWNATFKKSCVL